MARIKIDLPDRVRYRTEITVRVSDINYGGHVGNDNVLSLMHEARFRYIQAMGFKDELSVGNIGIIVADAAIVYKAEAFFGDRLTVEIFADDFNKYGFDMYYRLLHTEKGREIARGKTGIVCMNYSERKIAHIPNELLTALDAGEL